MVAEWRGVLEPLRDHEYFDRVAVDPEIGTIAWPNGVDMAPEPSTMCAPLSPLRLEVSIAGADTARVISLGAPVWSAPLVIEFSAVVRAFAVALSVGFSTPDGRSARSRPD
jgi:hypothetical protein